MAPRDPSKPQLDFPQLTADLIRQLNLTGVVGLLDFLDSVQPVYIVAQRAGALAFSSELPDFSSAAVFSGTADLPAGDTVIADTGSLPAGVYDIFIQMDFVGRQSFDTKPFRCQHRNAANTVTLATFAQLTLTTVSEKDNVLVPLFGYNIALNERVRLISPDSVMSLGGVSGSIFVQIRPAP